MSQKKYLVRLEPQEVNYLRRVSEASETPYKTVLRARVLLMANKDSYTDKAIYDCLRIAKTTPYHIRRRYASGGLQRSLNDARRSGRRRKMSPMDELSLALHSKTVPDNGHERWTIDMLHELAHQVNAVSRSTVYNILKRTPVPDDPAELLQELENTGQLTAWREMAY